MMKIDEKAVRAVKAWTKDTGWTLGDDGTNDGGAENFSQLAELVQIVADAAKLGGDPDRVMLCVGEEGNAIGGTFLSSVGAEHQWAVLECLAREKMQTDKFIRQIVEVHLKRPEAPAVVEGRVVE